jgi:lipoprotein-anchoring transpeptidase ErfK/SrfK
MRLFRRYGSAGNYRYSYTAYGIHGTNQEWVIGTKASHGCIRLYNKDIMELFPRVPLGTMVVTRQ